jgi:hypothetical protein
MRDQFQRAVNLIRKTGDRMIVFDSAKRDDGFVVMAMDEYERLALRNVDVRNLTEDELLDKINRDIAVWKSEQVEAGSPEEYSLKESEDFFAPEDGNRTGFQESGSGIRRRWSIPEERKEAAEEVDDIIEEDRQYLEQITF